MLFKRSPAHWAVSQNLYLVRSKRPLVDALPPFSFEFILGLLRGLPEKDAIEILRQYVVLEFVFNSHIWTLMTSIEPGTSRQNVDLFNCVSEMSAQDLADQFINGDLTAFRSLTPESVIDENNRFRQIIRR